MMLIAQIALGVFVGHVLLNIMDAWVGGPE